MGQPQPALNYKIEKVEYKVTRYPILDGGGTAGSYIGANGDIVIKNIILGGLPTGSRAVTVNFELFDLNSSEPTTPKFKATDIKVRWQAGHNIEVNNKINVETRATTKESRKYFAGEDGGLDVQIRVLELKSVGTNQAPAFEEQNEIFFTLSIDLPVVDIVQNDSATTLSTTTQPTTTPAQNSATTLATTTQTGLYTGTDTDDDTAKDFDEVFEQEIVVQQEVVIEPGVTRNVNVPSESDKIALQVALNEANRSKALNEAIEQLRAGAQDQINDLAGYSNEERIRLSDIIIQTIDETIVQLQQEYNDDRQEDSKLLYEVSINETIDSPVLTGTLPPGFVYINPSLPLQESFTPVFGDLELPTEQSIEIVTDDQIEVDEVDEVDDQPSKLSDEAKLLKDLCDAEENCDTLNY